MVFTWLHKLTQRWFGMARPKARPRSRCRPRLEVLEDRFLPSVDVVTNVNDHGPGSLRDTIAQAAPGDTIAFDPSLAGGTIVLTSGSNAAITIDKDLTIEGLGANNLAISGNHLSRVFTILAGANVAMNGITVEDGHNFLVYGGGIFNEGNLTLQDCTIQNNTVGDNYNPSYGGGIYNDNTGDLTLINSKVAGNSAFYGAGLYNEAGHVEIIDSIFSLNVTQDPANGVFSGSGGGVSNYMGSVNVYGSTFSGNSSDNGGALANDAGVMAIDQSTFSGNLAGERYGPGEGGAILNAGTLGVAYSIFSGNLAEESFGRGGAIFSDGEGPSMIDSCTFFNNSASYKGGAIDNLGLRSESMNIVNSTFFNNTSGGNGGAIADELGAALAIQSCTIDANLARSGGGGGLSVEGESSNVTLDNTIVANNMASITGYDVSGNVTSQGFNLIGAIDGSSGWVDSDITGTQDNPVDAHLGILAYNGCPTPVQVPLYGSPALGNGDPSLAGTLDQCGGTRGHNGQPVDIGAVQVDY